MSRSPWAPALAAALTITAAIGIASPAGAAVAPNGNVAYVCENAQYLPDICTVDPDTGAVTNLTNDDAFDSWPSWSPDGTQIAFGSDYSLYVMNADGTGRRHVTGGYDRFSMEPAWSPDGTRIAFVSTRGDTDYELYTVPASGETPATPATRLTTTVPDEWGRGMDDYQPTWSPDSARIAFVSQSRTLLDACDIYVMDSLDRDGDGNGDALQRLTETDSYNCSATEDINPAWSPTGDLIAFQSVRDGQAEIYVMDSDGSNQRNVTNHEVWDSFPGWSPDGTQITFTSGRDGDDEIYSLALADVPAPVATASASRVRARRAQVAATPVKQLTHNDTQDRVSDWGASTVDELPATKVVAPAMNAALTHKAAKAPLARGTVADDRGVASVSVALRERRRDGRCDWWTGRTWKRGACGARTWLKATGTTSWSWRMPKLQKTVGSRRDYTLYARATDSGGQVERTLTGGRNAITFTVR